MTLLNSIHSKAYRLISPGQFKEEDIEHELKEGEVAVCPSLVSICHADLRYYTGNRKKEDLINKLPMALFHEGIGSIVASRDQNLKIGEKVIIVPSIPYYKLRQINKEDCCGACRRGANDNYCEKGIFLGSGYDGIGQSCIVLPSENAIPIPTEVSDEIALLAELCSISLAGINRLHLEKIKQEKIAVFGDGPVGYLTAAILSHIYEVPSENLLVFGADREKLVQFDFATQHHIENFNFSSEKDITIAIECTGGNFSEDAINQAIDILAYESDLILLGVTEERIRINTRSILEKGITISGSSRSSSEDFKALMRILPNKQFQQTIAKLIPNEIKSIYDINDLKQVMENVATNKGWKKTYLRFIWEEDYGRSKVGVR